MGHENGKEKRGLQFCRDLRKVQMRTKCSDKTCNDFIRTFGPRLPFEPPRLVWSCDSQLHKLSGMTMLVLNGCIGCNQYVFLPTEQRNSCPRCGANRFNESGQPYEVILFCAHTTINLLTIIHTRFVCSVFIIIRSKKNCESSCNYLRTIGCCSTSSSAQVILTL